tara:strand:+ start:1202 stop:1513 length:312 start_codon:yes stop_codon:yes gene_type:complete
LPDSRQQLGQVCEAILTEYMLRLGYFVYRPLAHQGPADLICVNEAGNIILLDSKSDKKRINPGRKKATRIYRPRSDVQKRLDVHIAYVDAKTRAVHITPRLGQ